MKKTLKVFEIIFQVILVIIIIINLISIVSVKIMKNPYPNVFGYSYFTVISGSMKPTINVGDEVIVKIIKIDDRGKVSLTIKGVTEEEAANCQQLMYKL